MTHKSSFALEDLLWVVGCREMGELVMGELEGASGMAAGAAVGPYSHPRMPMFSRALMWDSSSCEAKSRAEGGVGGAPQPSMAPGLSSARAGQMQQQPSQHRHLIISGNKPPAGTQAERWSCVPHPTPPPCIRPLPAHIQHGRVPPELHEVLAELALVFIQDICVAGTRRRVSGTRRRGCTPATSGPGSHRT